MCKERKRGDDKALYDNSQVSNVFKCCDLGYLGYICKNRGAVTENALFCFATRWNVLQLLMEFAYAKWKTPKEFDNSLLMPSCWWRSDYTPLKKSATLISTYVVCLFCLFVFSLFCLQQVRFSACAEKRKKQTQKASCEGLPWAPARPLFAAPQDGTKERVVAWRRTHASLVRRPPDVTRCQRERKKIKRKSAPSTVVHVLLQLVSHTAFCACIYTLTASSSLSVLLPLKTLLTILCGFNMITGK